MSILQFYYLFTFITCLSYVTRLDTSTMTVSRGGKKVKPSARLINIAKAIFVLFCPLTFCLVLGGTFARVHALWANLKS